MPGQRSDTFFRAFSQQALIANLLQGGCGDSLVFRSLQGQLDPEKPGVTWSEFEAKIPAQVAHDCPADG